MAVEREIENTAFPPKAVASLMMAPETAPAPPLYLFPAQIRAPNLDGREVF